MRYAELASIPGTPEEARNNIIDIITVYLSDNKTEIPMARVLKMMHNQGYDLTGRMVMDVLKDNDSVKRITKDTIYLKGGDEDFGEIPDAEEEKAEKHIASMAKKAIKRERTV